MIEKLYQLIKSNYPVITKMNRILSSIKKHLRNSNLVF